VFGATGAAAKLGIPRSTLDSKITSPEIDKKPLQDSVGNLRAGDGCHYRLLPY